MILIFHCDWLDCDIWPAAPRRTFEWSNFFLRPRYACIFTTHCFFSPRTYNSRPDSRRRRLRSTKSAMSRYCSRPRRLLKSIPAIQIKFLSCSRWRKLSAAVISCGRRTIKQLRARQYRKYDIPGRLDSRSNPRLVGVFSLPFPSNARAVYRGFTVAWSQSHENWVAPRAYRRARLCNRSTLWSSPFNPAIWRSIVLDRPSEKLPFGFVAVALIARSM